MQWHQYVNTTLPHYTTQLHVEVRTILSMWLVERTQYLITARLSLGMFYRHIKVQFKWYYVTYTWFEWH